MSLTPATSPNASLRTERLIVKLETEGLELDLIPKRCEKTEPRALARLVSRR